MYKLNDIYIVIDGSKSMRKNFLWGSRIRGKTYCLGQNVQDLATQKDKSGAKSPDPGNLALPKKVCSGF